MQQVRCECRRKDDDDPHAPGDAEMSEPQRGYSQNLVVNRDRGRDK